MTIPAWLQALGISHVRYEAIDARLRVKGSDPDPERAVDDMMKVCEAGDPPGFRIHLIKAGVEHARGTRLSWIVEWIADDVAEGQRERRKAQRERDLRSRGIPRLT